MVIVWLLYGFGRELPDREIKIGIGERLVAEGWIDDAVRFWEAQMPQGTTATEHVHAAAQDATAYDLQGRPVSSGYKGIIIQNGHKYISL